MAGRFEYDIVLYHDPLRRGVVMWINEMPASRKGNVARPRIDAGMRGTVGCVKLKSEVLGIPGVPEI